MKAQRITRAQTLKGEIQVPGELAEAARALLLSAISDGICKVSNMPLGSGRMLSWLQSVGIEISRHETTVEVCGRGLRALNGVNTLVDLTDIGDAAVPALAVLAGQGVEVRARVSSLQLANSTKLVELLARMGIDGSVDGNGIVCFAKNNILNGVKFTETNLEPSVKLALLLAGLYCDGETVVREPLSSKDRVDQILRHRGVDVVPSRDSEARTMSVGSDQQLQKVSLTIPGQLQLALPIVVAASVLKGSEICVDNVQLRSPRRPFIDLMRQIGAAIEIVDRDDGVTDLVVSAGKLKATRVADKRAERILKEMAMLSVLATQVEGEFIIRDITTLCHENNDLVGYVVHTLRRMGAKVGKYPEGFVIEGGKPLKGTDINCRHDLGFTMAFTVAGLFADGETELRDTACMKQIFPGFYDILGSLQGKRKGGRK